MLVRRTLEFTAGWDVATAGSGRAGIELARSMHPAPQVIVVDVMMPEMDGYEVCRRLKGDAVTAEVPIVLLTARRDLDARRLAEARGGRRAQGARRRSAGVPRDRGGGERPLARGAARGGGRAHVADQRRRRHARNLSRRDREGATRPRLSARERCPRRRVWGALLPPNAVRQSA